MPPDVAFSAELLARIDPTDIAKWPTRKEAAVMLGGLNRLNRCVANGRLNPETDSEGANRYNPEELRIILDNPYPNGSGGANPFSGPGIVSRNSKSREEIFKELELGTIRSLVDLVRAPREKIDQILFGMIDRLEKENIELRAALTKGRLEVEQAQDATSERELAAKIMIDESAVKRMAGERLVGTLAALLGGSKAGIELSDEQLRELALVDDFLTPDQKKQAQRIIVANAGKVSQGKLEPKPEPKPEAKSEVQATPETPTPKTGDT